MENSFVAKRFQYTSSDLILRGCFQITDDPFLKELKKSDSKLSSMVLLDLRGTSVSPMCVSNLRRKFPKLNIKYNQMDPLFYEMAKRKIEAREGLSEDAQRVLHFFTQTGYPRFDSIDTAKELYLYKGSSSELKALCITTLFQNIHGSDLGGLRSLYEYAKDHDISRLIQEILYYCYYIGADEIQEEFKNELKNSSYSEELFVPAIPPEIPIPQEYIRFSSQMENFNTCLSLKGAISLLGEANKIGFTPMADELAYQAINLLLQDRKQFLDTVKRQVPSESLPSILKALAQRNEVILFAQLFSAFKPTSLDLANQLLHELPTYSHKVWTRELVRDPQWVERFIRLLNSHSSSNFLDLKDLDLNTSIEILKLHAHKKELVITWGAENLYPLVDYGFTKSVVYIDFSSLPSFKFHGKDDPLLKIFPNLFSVKLPRVVNFSESFVDPKNDLFLLQKIRNGIPQNARAQFPNTTLALRFALTHKDYTDWTHNFSPQEMHLFIHANTKLKDPALQTLNFRGQTQVTPEIISNLLLPCWRTKYSVDFSYCNSIPKEFIYDLFHHEKLIISELYLQGCKQINDSLFDERLYQKALLEEVKIIDLRGTSVTPKKVFELRKKFPRLEIKYDEFYLSKLDCSRSHTSSDNLETSRALIELAYTGLCPVLSYKIAQEFYLFDDASFNDQMKKELKEFGRYYLMMHIDRKNAVEVYRFAKINEDPILLSAARMFIEVHCHPQNPEAETELVPIELRDDIQQIITEPFKITPNLFVLNPTNTFASLVMKPEDCIQVKVGKGQKKYQLNPLILKQIPYFQSALHFKGQQPQQNCSLIEIEPKTFDMILDYVQYGKLPQNKWDELTFGSDFLQLILLNQYCESKCQSTS